MTYMIEYRGNSGNVQSDKVFGILGTLLNFVESNQADYTRIYAGIGHDRGETMEIGFVIRDIPDSETPVSLFDVIDEFVEFEINGPNDTTFPLSDEGTRLSRQ